MMAKTISPKEGFKNRHIEPLPKTPCRIYAIILEERTDEPVLCDWEPFDPANYTPDKMPGKGYQGTARRLDRKIFAFGYHAWEQNDFEFLYYRLAE